jgi:hypothetical protein
MPSYLGNAVPSRSSRISITHKLTTLVRERTGKYKRFKSRSEREPLIGLYVCHKDSCFSYTVVYNCSRNDRNPLRGKED